MNNSWNGFLKRQPNDASNWVDQRLSYNGKTILINGFENLENGGYGFMIHLGKREWIYPSHRMAHKTCLAFDINTNPSRRR